MNILERKGFSVNMIGVANIKFHAAQKRNKDIFKFLIGFI